MRALAASLAVALIAVAAGDARHARAAAQPADVPLLDLLVERLGDYLQNYERQLSTLVADEQYHQQRTYANRARFGARRQLDSEVMFLRLPGGGEWFGIRDVRKVDKKAVPAGGPTLADLMKTAGTDFVAHARAIVEASSRHNLDAGRTINMPTVPLEALSVQNHPRYIFELRGKDRVGKTETQRLDFSEFDEPTLVHGTNGATLWSRGSAWIEAESGRVWRAELIVGPDPPGIYRRRDLEARVRVEFVHDAALDMLVPKQMTEDFWIRGGRGLGRAQYVNFRRFSTSARIIP